MLFECAAELLSVVVVAGNDKEWQREPLEQLRQSLVFPVVTCLNGVTGDYDEVGLPVQRLDMVDRFDQVGTRISDSLVQLTPRPDMQVRQLGNQEIG